MKTVWAVLLIASLLLSGQASVKHQETSSQASSGEEYTLPPAH